MGACKPAELLPYLPNNIIHDYVVSELGSLNFMLCLYTGVCTCTQYAR